jgi:hypothetical protein
VVNLAVNRAGEVVNRPVAERSSQHVGMTPDFAAARKTL